MRSNRTTSLPLLRCVTTRSDRTLSRHRHQPPNHRHFLPFPYPAHSCLDVSRVSPPTPQCPSMSPSPTITISSSPSTTLASLHFPAPPFFLVSGNYHHRLLMFSRSYRPCCLYPPPPSSDLRLAAPPPPLPTIGPRLDLPLNPSTGEPRTQTR